MSVARKVQRKVGKLQSAKRVSKKGITNKDIYQLQLFLGQAEVLKDLSACEVLANYQRGPKAEVAADRVYVVFIAVREGGTGHYHVWRTDKNKKVTDTDSYKLQLQLPGTQGLCMLFAAFIAKQYLMPGASVGVFVPGMYVNNVAAALVLAAKGLKDIIDHKVDYTFHFDGEGEFDKFSMSYSKCMKLCYAIANSEEACRAISSEQHLPK